MKTSSGSIHYVSLEVEALEDRQVLSTASYVTGLYTTLLHRTPAPSEVAPWVTAIDAGVSPQAVALEITTSQEFENNLVVSDYQNILGRAPSPQEAAGWVTALQNGLTDQQLVSAFLGSSEYFQKAGGTNSAWLNGVYQVVLSRAPDAAGQAAWTQALQSGVALSSVAEAIENSPESLARIVTALYQGVLGRPVDPQGLASGIAALEKGMTPAQLESLLASSVEYINDHGGLDAVTQRFPADTYIYHPCVGPVGFIGGTTAGFTGGGFTGGGFTGGGFTGGGGGSGSGS